MIPGGHCSPIMKLSSAQLHPKRGFRVPGEWMSRFCKPFPSAGLILFFQWEMTGRRSWPGSGTGPGGLGPQGLGHSIDRCPQHRWAVQGSRGRNLLKALYTCMSPSLEKRFRALLWFSKTAMTLKRQEVLIWGTSLHAWHWSFYGLWPWTCSQPALDSGSASASFLEKTHLD